MPYYRLYYHFVWATKDRLPLITPSNREPIYATIRAKTNEFGGIVHAINGMPDHVHLVVTLPPSVALSTFIGQVKGSSSHLASRLVDAAPEARFAWQAEYGVVSVSETQVRSVVRYVYRQQQHHAANDLNRVLESYG